MKVVVSTLNAKYIHTSLAIRLLYVANQKNFDINFLEYTIKEDLNKIAEELISTSCTILGLGVYIWNVSHIMQLIEILKQKKKELIIILGGPEVSYDSTPFIENYNVDYIVKGEGEIVFGELLSALRDNTTTDIPGICSKAHSSNVVRQTNLLDLSKFQSPYSLERDKESLKNRLVYFESSRGCPYRCSYCLSSLEKGVRYFPQSYIETNLTYLIESGAKQIKFLDRTFNLNKKHTKTIFEFLLEKYRPDLSCQFEIYADLLSDEIIDYLNTKLPTNYFRFEIGVQSTHAPSLEAVKRYQDFSLIARNINRISNAGKIDLHLDLIAGLPYEDYNRFKQSFNDVFALNAKELQLGFLKLLRGTQLRKSADLHGYKYDPIAPYQIISNNYLSESELNAIHQVEDMLDKFWNSGRFKNTFKKLFSDFQRGEYFDFFLHLSFYFEENKYRSHSFSLEELYQCLHGYLVSQNLNYLEILFTDYYGNFNIRPTSTWIQTLEKAERKRLLYKIGQDKFFLEEYGLNRKIVEKQTALNSIDGRYLLTVFMKNTKYSIEYICD